MFKALVIAFVTFGFVAVGLGQNPIPITYQGVLSEGGARADGLYDFRFTVYDDQLAGVVIAGPLDFVSVPVADGLFQVELDYPRDGKAGEGRWLEVQTKPAGAASFDVVSPRQRITAAPEAGNTEAARLQPDGRVLIGTGSDLGIGTALDTVVLPSTFPIRDAEFVQTFIAEASGTPLRIGGLFNDLPVAAVHISVEIYSPGSPQAPIASGSVDNVTTKLSVINFDSVTGLLLCGEPYEIAVSYTRVADGLPAFSAVTGGLPNDVYPFGEVVGRNGIDMVASIAVERGATQVTVFDDGLALLNGGLIVGPDDSGDAGVVLPKGSVNPSETLGEPGVIQSVPADPADPAQTLRVARVLAPVDGYVMAIGSAQATLPGFNGGELSLTSSAGVQYSQVAQSGLGTILGQGTQSVQIPVTVHGVFPISANEQVDIYLRGGTVFSNPLLNAMFFPTSYAAPSPVTP
ncbi:MAG: hypothetical protein AAF297_11415 [Planctomycetota bacterium]